MRLRLPLLLAALACFSPSASALGDAEGTIGERTAFGIRPALDEILLGTSGRVEQWPATPELVVLLSVLQYDPNPGLEFVATDGRLPIDDADALVADLTSALALFSNGRMTTFARVRREQVDAGTRVSTLRTGQIVVGRYRGLREASLSIGLGGRALRRGGTIRAGSVMLDAEYDRSGEKRRLLRTHELGHALGFNHVASTVSIMNPRIGPEPTPLDREAARLAAAARTE